MRTNHYSLLIICLFLSVHLFGQKKAKEYSISELKKGELNAKSFKDYPESKSRILFDLGKLSFIHDLDTFRLERTRQLRIKFLEDSTLTAHELGLTSFDHEELESLIHYSMIGGDLSSKEISAVWKGINKYSPLLIQLQNYL